MHSTSHVWQPRHYLLNAFFRCGMSHKLCSNQFSNDSKTSLLMNFCRSLKSIWSSLFETRHWLQDKIASPYEGWRYFSVFFYIRLKGDFFFISGCGQNVISALFSELSTHFKITMYKMFMKYKVQQPKISTCRATSDIIHLLHDCEGNMKIYSLRKNHISWEKYDFSGGIHIHISPECSCT